MMKHISLMCIAKKYLYKYRLIYQVKYKHCPWIFVLILILICVKRLYIINKILTDILSHIKTSNFNALARMCRIVPINLLYINSMIINL